jgi:hypothetical protein
MLRGTPPSGTKRDAFARPLAPHELRIVAGGPERVGRVLGSAS